VSINESAPITSINDIQSGFPEQFQQPTATPTIDPDNPPWGVLTAFVIWVISIGLLLFVPFVLIVPYVIYKISSEATAAGLGGDSNLIFLSILGVLPAHALTFLVVWYVVTNRGRRPFWQTLGWTWPRDFGPWKTIGLAVLLFGGGWLITHYLGGPETQLDAIIKSSYKARIVTAFLAAITGPFVEELIYRGVLYPALRRIFGVIAGVVIVSVLFTGVHVVQYYNNFGVIAVIAVLSVVLTLVRARAKSLLPSYVIHFVFNGVQALLLLLQPVIEKHISQQSAQTDTIIYSILRLFS
jgi:CAAX protease family protein